MNSITETEQPKVNLYGFTKALMSLLYVNAFLCVIYILQREVPKGELGW